MAKRQVQWTKHKSFKDSFILLLLWVRTECKFPSTRKTSCPNTQEILLLALNKAVKVEAKLVASDELKAFQQVQDSKSFHTLPTWDRRECMSCPLQGKQEAGLDTKDGNKVTVINNASGP